MATSWAHNPKTSNACAGSSPAPEPRRGLLRFILAQTTEEEAWVRRQPPITTRPQTAYLYKQKASLTKVIKSFYIFFILFMKNFRRFSHGYKYS